MKNLHLLHTDKDSNLFIGDLSGQLHFNYSIEKGSSRNQHIYITSDEEIKEGDWCLSKLNEVILFGINYNKNLYKKIILTTDQNLDGVQAIDDDFLEWFVHNPSCEEVNVITYGDYLSLHHSDSFHSVYKIIIPKEEQCTCKKHDPYCCHIHGSCPTCVKKEEPKQETLEEAAERLFPFTKDDSENRIITIKRLSWIEGAKWQQERMYSEEEVLEIIALFVNDSPHNTKEWFEQFKKKTQ